MDARVEGKDARLTEASLGNCGKLHTGPQWNLHFEVQTPAAARRAAAKQFAVSYEKTSI